MMMIVVLCCDVLVCCCVVVVVSLLHIVVVWLLFSTFERLTLRKHLKQVLISNLHLIFSIIMLYINNETTIISQIQLFNSLLVITRWVSRMRLGSVKLTSICH